ncbi:ExbD/TolR family protein [Alienimonas sp. DA493]|uniref:ExbD/TolR family protein n=1 Tax=Alienimonas sp. DA493 TaxID=3373605 RepID=UPI0037549C37
MRTPARRRTTLRFSMTPLIDVTFLLVTFFLAASQLVKIDAGERVDLPSATLAAAAEAATPNRVTVTVAADGTLRVAGQVRDRVFVAALFADAGSKPDPEVRLRCDRAAPFSEVEPLLVACAEAGVRDVKFAVLQREGGGGDR